MPQLDKRLFTGGMDQDSEDRFVEQGSYRFALNVHVASADGPNKGAVENVRGNVLVSFILPAGNKVIGAYDDKLNDVIYYFVVNSAGKHSILQYDPVPNSVTKVLESALLNFRTDFLITGVNLVEGKLLYWTDDFNPPRKINIDKAIRFTQSGGKDPLGYKIITEQTIDAVKHPPQCEPFVQYGDDETKNVNYLEDKLFQFKYRWIYDDDEKSTWSPVSKLAIPKAVCQDFFQADRNNHINITIETGFETVKRIEIAAREGNIGDFFSINDIDKKEENIPDDTIIVIPFFNEKNYVSIELNRSVQLFDSLPLKAKAQELIDGNRITYGNILEGYDPVKVDTELNLSFGETIKPQTGNITGTIVIKNLFADKDEFAQNQPIHDLGKDGFGTGTVFGGIATAGNGHVKDVGTVYNQILPLNGFVVYLAGTDFFAISKQADVSKATQFANGVVDSSSVKKRNKIRDDIRDRNFKSIFTIKDVPEGIYILRIANHRTTLSDLNNGTRAYQNTSTYTLLTGGPGNTSVDWHERVIKVEAGKTVNLGPTNIADLTIPQRAIANTGETIIIDGYVRDKDQGGTQPTQAEILASTAIELAAIQFSDKTGGWNNLIDSFEVTNKWKETGTTFTDHNGFFFFALHAPFLQPIGQKKIKAEVFSIAPSSFSNLLRIHELNDSDIYEDTGGTALFPGIKFPVRDLFHKDIVRKGYVIRNRNDDVTKFARTEVTGQIFDTNGTPVKGVNVAMTRGKVDETDSNGEYRIIAYGDAKPLFSGSAPQHGQTVAGVINFIYSNQPNIREELLTFSLGRFCFGSFAPPLTELVNADTGVKKITFSGQQGVAFNNVDGDDPFNIYPIIDIIATIIGISPEIALKRGGVYQFGIVYYDRANRSTTTNSNDKTNSSFLPEGLKLEIPFYTELSDPNNTPNGKPIIKWKIKNKPPAFATHYQWVRTKNSTLNRYLQFSIKKVEFLDKQGNTLSAQIPSEIIKISIENIIDFQKRNRDSQIAYVPIAGDRVRFIKDTGGSFFETYIDTRVRGFGSDPDVKADLNFIFLENISGIPPLSSGIVFEIYTPKLVVKAEDDIFFEFGECFEIGNPGKANRFHKGPVEDQNPNNLSGIPAAGQFTGGDTYYRLREIPHLATSGVLQFNLHTIDDASFSDFFASQFQDTGRPNKIDKDFRQVRRPTVIFHSGIFIPETKINDLNNFFDTAFETYDRDYGSIQKLYAENKRLICYQELKIGQILVNEAIIFDRFAQGNVAASETILSDIVYYAGEWGIGLQPESFAVYGFRKYNYDPLHGVVLRLSQDGITPISQYRMENFWRDKSKEILESGNIRINTYGVFDKEFDEYILAVEETFFGESPAKTIFVKGETIAFNEEANRWTSFYSFRPEFMSTLRNGIVTFNKGRIFIHNKSNIYNNFYGQQFDSEIHVVSNQNPSDMKIFQATSQETADTWSVPEILTPNGQKSNLISDDFEEKENFQYAAFLFDENTPNTATPLIEGDVLRDTSVLLKMKNTLTKAHKLFAVNVLWTKSERSNK